MLDTAKAARIFMGLLVVMVSFGSQASYADGRRHHDDDHHRRYFHRHHGDSNQGLRISIGPNDSFSIRLGESRHHYHRPYYKRVRNDYIVVSNPVTYVQPVPVFVNSTTPVMVTAAANTFNGDDLYMVNVPNDRNGYTSVTIKRAGNGFVGPQGEYYSDFPQVNQLKAMYIK